MRARHLDIEAEAPGLARLLPRLGTLEDADDTFRGAHSCQDQTLQRSSISPTTYFVAILDAPLVSLSCWGT